MRDMKERSKNTNKEMMYIIYMMVGSYFKSTRTDMKVLEKKLFLSYFTMKEKKQLLYEDLCLGYVERTLKKELPSSLWDESVAVGFDPEQTSVSFLGRNWVLTVNTSCTDEGRVKLTHSFVSKSNICNYSNRNRENANYKRTA